MAGLDLARERGWTAPSPDDHALTSGASDTHGEEKGK
jgi:hypothetical protein